MMKKSVVVTGASSGIGLGMAKKFLRSGYRVFGSVRSEEKAAELRADLGLDFQPLVFDICLADQVAAAAEQLGSVLGDERLELLINNAGSAEMGPLLHVPLDDFRRQLDALVVGQLGVVQEFYRFLLPPAKGAKAGRIINVSSVSGVNANPFFGCYAAGKHALEGLSKTLRKELSAMGISVVVVAPGNIRTAIWDKQTGELAERYRDTEYHEALKGLLVLIEGSIKNGAMTVEDFADALFEIATLASPAPRYTIEKARKRRLPFFRGKVQIIEE